LRCGALARRYRFGRRRELYSITANRKAIGARFQGDAASHRQLLPAPGSLSIAWRWHVDVVLQIGLSAGSDILSRQTVHNLPADSKFRLELIKS
jgi:hypothetical protein